MRILESATNVAFKAAIVIYVIIALLVGTSMGHKGTVWAIINGAAWPITLMHAALTKTDATSDKVEGKKSGSSSVDPSMLATLSKFETATPGGSAADPATPRAVTASLETAKPQATVQELARLLMAKQTSPTMQGFSIDKPMRCFAPGSEGGNWALRCRTILKDSGRGGTPAMVDVQLYDHDITFDDEIAVIKRHIADLTGRGDSVINSRPDMSMRNPQGNIVMAIQASCHQVLGSRNSPAYCGVLINPRTFVIVGIGPSRPSTGNVAVGSGDESGSSDVKHAADLAFGGLMLENYIVGRPSR